MAEVYLHPIGAAQPSIPNPNASLDVVFVHGLTGDAIGTWAAKGDPESFWPRWLAKDFPPVSVWSVDYDSSIFKTIAGGQGISLTARASSLLDILLSHGIGTRPVIFIAHSLGGLLVKRLLRICSDTLNPAYKKLLSATKAIAFCGTPHYGAKLASALSNILSIAVSAQVKQLQEDETQLKELHSWFINWVDEYRPVISAYCETTKTNGVWVVSQETADPLIPGCSLVPIDGDHIQLCKPISHESPLYVSIQSLVSRALKELPPAAGLTSILATPALKGPATEGPQSTSQLPVLGALVPGGPWLSHLYAAIGAANVPVAQDASGNGYQLKFSCAHQLPAEIATDFEVFTTVAPDDRRTLAEKLTVAHRGIEIPDAERAKERFAKSLYRNGSQAASLARYTRLMADVDTRFKLNVRPLISAGKDETSINGAVQQLVIQPALSQQLSETDDMSAAVVVSALYYLTGNCHVRWD